VARLAGVSQSTVSYVMSGRRSISSETRRRVEAAIEQLAFQPNAGARALKSQRTKVIGLVVPFGASTDSTGLLPFIETIATCAREQDHDVLLVTRDEGPAGLTRLASRSLCDAIVLMGIEARDARIPVAAALAVPVILIGLPADPHGLPCVDMDFELAGRLAVDHLAAGGHERIAVIGHPPDIVARDLNFVGRFRRGAAAAAERHGLPCEIIELSDRGAAAAGAAVDRALARPSRANGDAMGQEQAIESSEHGAAATHRALPTEPSHANGNAMGRGDAARPSSAEAGGDDRAGLPGGRLGIIVPNTEAVQSVLHALTGRGLVPGRDVSVVGLCTDVMAEATTPEVTNVSLEPRDVSRRAMRTLFRLLDRDNPPSIDQVDLISPRLTRRQTTPAV
jgi:DNA-binding LacI/PurR family transcriptional regulator